MMIERTRMTFAHFSLYLMVFWTMTSSAILASDIPAPDQDHRCEHWASVGECDKNPGYMLQSCQSSCASVNDSNAKNHKVDHIGSFFELKAPDIEGNMVDFEQFRGHTTIVTNVATYCGRTESHYHGLVKLWANLVKERQLPVRILAFPCNQFGQQEPGTAHDIQEFAHEQGVEFTMMGKINVNGPSAHEVYQYLKYKANVPMIQWNFDTYFVVNGKGQISQFSDVEPESLLDYVLSLHNTGEEL